mgnify:CR=1 FL=1
MTLIIHPDLPQGSDEWHDQRRGLVTASVVGQLLSTRRLTGIDYGCPACEVPAHEACRGKSGGAIKTLHPERTEFARQQPASESTIVEPASNPDSRNLTMLLTAERITGWTEHTFISDDMWRGLDDEPIARDAYSALHAPVVETGFMVEDRWGYRIGYSPDGLVGDDGLIEIKSRRPKAHLATILKDEVPGENMAQLQCGLLVSGRRWIDYISWCGGMPMWVKRVEPLQEWRDAIVAAVSGFEVAAAAMVDVYRAAVDGLPMTERTNRDVELKL